MNDGVVISSVYSGSAGNMVLIDHGGGIVSGYMHLQERHVTVGQKITKGQTIGLMGDTGVGTGVHLHFLIKVNGAAVDPLQYFSVKK